MDRRWAGLLVVAVVLLAAVATPSIIGRKVAGKAVPAAIPGPPTVGDCLLEPVSDLQEVDSSAIRAPTYPSFTIGACTGHRFGEVVGVIPAGKVEASQPLSSGTLSVSDPNRPPCNAARDAYSGPRSLVMTAGSSPWVSVAPIAVILAGPSPLQTSMGQGWLACVEIIADGDGRSASYSRTLHDVFRQAAMPPEAALCMNTFGAKQSIEVNCSQKHRAELFAYSAAEGISAEDFDTTCLSFVKRSTEMSDPTAGGRLEVYSQRPDIAGEPSYPPDRICLVSTTGTQSLVGPLVGLGDEPLPLTTG